MQKMVVKDGNGKAEMAPGPDGQAACVAAALPQAAQASSRDEAETEAAEDDADAIDDLPDRHSPLLVPFGLDP